jgi:hypothetical protein
MLWLPSMLASLPHAPCQRLRSQPAARVCCHASASPAVAERSRALGDALFVSLAHAEPSPASTPGLLSVPLVDAHSDAVPFSVSLLLGGAGLLANVPDSTAGLRGQRTLTFLLHGAAEMVHAAERTRLQAGDALSSSRAEALCSVAGSEERDGWAFAALQFVWPGSESSLPEAVSALRGGSAPALGAEAVRSLFRHAQRRCAWRTPPVRLGRARGRPL